MIKKVEKTNLGVNVRFTGNVKKEDIKSMVESCKSGECGCSCDSATFEKIESMEVAGDDGDVTISLNGKELSKEEIESAVEGCVL